MALGARPYEVCGRAVETLQRGGSLCQRPAREDADGTVKDVDGKALSENKYYSDLLHCSGRGRLAPAEKEGYLLILRGRDGPARVNVCNVVSCDRQND